MLKDYFGKLLFPRLHFTQYGHEFKIIAASIALGLIGAGILISVMIMKGSVGR
jgi:hypothetical protein